MRLLLTATLLSLLPQVAAAGAPEIPAPTGRKIVGRNARLELLFTRQVPLEGGLTEGPAVAPDGSIYFSDILRGTDKGMILRFDPKTKQTTVFAEDSGKSNGLIFDREGRLLACEGADHGGRRISRWDVKTGQRTTLTDNYEGKKFNAPNDICLDAAGRIYFTDPRYLGEETRELEHRAVYRIDPDGAVHEVTHDVVKPNGIAVSTDGKSLYVANHDNGTDKIDPTAPPPPQGLMNVVAFRLQEDGSVKGKPKTLVDFGEKKGCDGMCVDEQGNVYLAVRDAGRPGVMVVNRRGKEVAFIPTGPAGQSAADPAKPPLGLPSNVEFGIGDEANVLYVTVDTSLYRIPLKVKGYHVQYDS